MIGLMSRTTSPSSVDEQAQHAVRGRVVRADVERQQLVVLGVLEVRELDGVLHLAVGRARGVAAGGRA